MGAVLSWLLFGLLAGAVARLVTPGRHPIGCLPTIAVGIVGALVGGLVGQELFNTDARFEWDLGPFLLAVAGSVVLLLALQALGGRGRWRR